MSETPVIECDKLTKQFDDSGQVVSVLKEVSLRVAAGDKIAIMGRSGAGKSTLLHLLGGLDRPTSGLVSINGQEVSGLGPARIGRLRNRVLGFVYQFHHLMPEFTALENVSMPLLIRGERPAVASDAAGQILQRVGLEDRLQHKPSQLSGGERQRVALARAIVTRPGCLLADEPTGNLDDENSNKIIGLLHELHDEFNIAIVLVTHDRELAGQMQRLLLLQEGSLHPLQD